MCSNPSYDANKQNIIQEYSTYDYAVPNESTQLQNDNQNVIKLDINPSYGGTQEHENNSNNFKLDEPELDASIELNPTCSRRLMKTYEDHDVYVEIDQDHSQSAEGTGYLELIGPTTQEMSPAVAVDAANVMINPNPSYELLTGGVRLQDNPSYNKIKFYNIS